MPKVIVSREARRDLEGIRAYIRDDLANPDAARRILGELKKCVLSLSSMPGRGKPLDALLSVHTDYRYLVCENYCVFYLTGDALSLIHICLRLGGQPELLARYAHRGRQRAGRHLQEQSAQISARGYGKHALL